jgi:predicted nucleotidyltransferase component of viral defense system
MEQPTQVQIIEIFHLLFLQTLSARSQEWFVLKGGANIRYFFDSHRYSNDIDLDFVNKEGWSVEQSVDKVLSGAALTMLLRRERIEVVELSKPKQTEMTRRWKIGLGRTGFPGPPVRTKIEFSQRPGASDDVLAERIPDFVVAPYGIMSIVVRHYGLTAAIEQKIAALALRSETKARDVFASSRCIRE